MVTVFLCSVLVFVIIRLIPGDPIDHLLGERAHPLIRQELMHKWGFDQPLYKQYLTFVSHLLKGDLGHSVISGRGVLREFGEHFPATMELAFFSLLFALVVGTPLGFLSALKPDSFWDFLCTGGGQVGYSMSVFWLGLVLMGVFSLFLDLTPVSGRIHVLYDFEPLSGWVLIDAFFQKNPLQILKSGILHLLLPVLTLSTIPLVHIMRMTRFSLLEVLNENFMRTARAKGVGAFRFYVVHGFRNALIPLVSIMGSLTSALLTGAVLTETVFAWPGLGRWLITAVLARDYPVLQGGILLITFLTVFIHFLVDLLYLFIDPRITFSPS